TVIQNFADSNIFAMTIPRIFLIRTHSPFNFGCESGCLTPIMDRHSPWPVEHRGLSSMPVQPFIQPLILHGIIGDSPQSGAGYISAFFPLSVVVSAFEGEPSDNS